MTIYGTAYREALAYPLRDAAGRRVFRFSAKRRRALAARMKREARAHGWRRA